MCEIGEKLVSLNQRGLFFGPSEGDEAFFQRAGTSAGRSGFHSEGLGLIEKQFDSSPDWIEVFTQSKGLPFWEGAATWIEENPNGSRSCRIQIKDSFLARLYSTEEVVAHEMVHAVRLMFDEKRFEEILAYRTSKSWFRRYFGPLFSGASESKWFLGAIGLSWVIYLVEMVFDFPVFGNWVLLLPIFLLSFLALRLRKSQGIFAAALRNLETRSSNPLGVALRLTDQEIELFAQSTSDEIDRFLKGQQEGNLRWKQIYLSYFLT